MPAADRAVFLSYASQDAAVVSRICDALRGAGIEVWFDQNELVGGDAWDKKIRTQIKECALFVPVISANTNARPEGYFRLEWLLAVERSRLMSDDHPFLFPIVIDDTSDAAARVPDKFRDVQWTRLNVKDTPESLAQRVASLLGSEGPGRGGPTPSNAAYGKTAAGPGDSNLPRNHSSWLRYVSVIGGLAIGLVYALRPMWSPPRARESQPAAMSTALPAPVVARSEASRLAEKARVIFEKIDSNADDFAMAESLLKRALELDATDGEIWAISARLNSAYVTRHFERSTARAEAARRQAERAVKLAPESAATWHALGRSLFLTDVPRAEEAMQQAVKLAPNDGHILISLGSVSRLLGRPDEALAYYVRAAAQPDVRPLALYDQFLIHFYLRRYAEAERCAQASIAGVPTTINLTGLAILEIAWRGQVGSAQRILAEAPAAMRAEPRMVFMSALVALMAKQTDEALRALDRLPGDFINDAWYSGPKALLIGLAHTQASRAEAARIAWEAGITVVRHRLQETSNDPELHLRLGELLAWTGQTDAALREARAFEELQRNRTDWTYSSSRIYAALGRATDAVPILEKFLAATSTGRWPLTPAILRLDPIWDKLRDDPRFQKLATGDLPATGAVAPKVDDHSAPADKSAVAEKSVAVLAFANLSDDKGNEYFSDGISEELLNVLAKIPGLKVSARTSAFHFKGKDTPIPEIAKQLGVAYVVEGSVRKSGSQVRITAQLIKAPDGFHVWSDTFTRELKDIFAVQDEIAGLIAKNLQLKLAIGGERSAVNPEIYEMLLQARALARRESNEGRKQAIALYRRALAAEPRLAVAWAEMARAYVALGRFAGQPIAEALREARAAAQQACALNPDQPVGLGALALVQRTADWDWRGAQRSFQRAMELAPGEPAIMSDAAVLFFNIGRVDEAIALARQAVERDPLSASAQFYFGVILEIAGRFEESLGPLTKAVGLAPAADEFHYHLARALMSLGRLADAAKAVELEPNEAFRLVGQAQLRHARGDRAGAAKSLDELIARFGAELPGYVAMTCAVLGDKEQAFAWFDRALARRDAAVVWTKTNYYLRSLHGDPRWPEFLKKMGLADEQLK